MHDATRNWLIKFAATFALLMAPCWAVPRFFANLPEFPPVTAGQVQEEVFDRYFKLPQADIVIVGSSLAYHLKDWYFEHGDVRNASIPGGTPNTGLAIIDAAPAKLPRVIAIETNVLERELDQPLFDKFRNATRPQRPLQVMRTLAAWYEDARNGTLTYSEERIQAVLTAPPATDRSEAAVGLSWEDWNRPLNRAAMLEHARMLKALTEKLEARGVRIFFFEMPYPSRLNASLSATTEREVLAEVIRPDDNRRLALDYPAEQMRSEADGVHLDDRSSVIFAAALDKAIHDRLARK